MARRNPVLVFSANTLIWIRIVSAPLVPADASGNRAVHGTHGWMDPGIRCACGPRSGIGTRYRDLGRDGDRHGRDLGVPRMRGNVRAQAGRSEAGLGNDRDRLARPRSPRGGNANVSADIAVAPILHATRIGKRFGAVTALESVDIEVYPGEITGLVGDNGAGKSTLIKIISGVHHADSGTVEFDGKTVSFDSAAE